MTKELPNLSASIFGILISSAYIWQARAIEEIRRSCQADEAKAVWAGQGAEFPNLTGAAFDGFIKAELKKWSQVVKASGAKLD